MLNRKSVPLAPLSGDVGERGELILSSSSEPNVVLRPGICLRYACPLTGGLPKSDHRLCHGSVGFGPVP